MKLARIHSDEWMGADIAHPGPCLDLEEEECMTYLRNFELPL